MMKVLIYLGFLEFDMDRESHKWMGDELLSRIPFDEVKYLEDRSTEFRIEFKKEP